MACGWPVCHQEKQLFSYPRSRATGGGDSRLTRTGPQVERLSNANHVSGGYSNHQAHKNQSGRIRMQLDSSNVHREIKLWQNWRGHDQHTLSLWTHLHGVSNIKVNISWWVLGSEAQVRYRIWKGDSIGLGWFAVSVSLVVIHPERGILLPCSLAKSITPLKPSATDWSVWKFWHSDSSFSMFYCWPIRLSTPLPP